MDNKRPETTASRAAALLVEQEDEWPNHLLAAKKGNQFATLCRHCYGRHAPPRDEICPHPEPPK